ncbi:MAG: hypothetical protein JW725_00985 [Candidatus Babeliaceae bacterium]|nr:hypothetical protein [Candidatus Babeliaceae bacterium]
MTFTVVAQKRITGVAEVGVQAALWMHARDAQSATSVAGSINDQVYRGTMLSAYAQRSTGRFSGSSFLPL